MEIKQDVKILINGLDVTKKFKTEQDIYLTATYFKTLLQDKKPFKSSDVRVNGLNQYFIENKDKSRTYFKDISIFEFKN